MGASIEQVEARERLTAWPRNVLDAVVKEHRCLRGSLLPPGVEGAAVRVCRVDHERMKSLLHAWLSDLASDPRLEQCKPNALETHVAVGWGKGKCPLV